MQFSIEHIFVLIERKEIAGCKQNVFNYLYRFIKMYTGMQLPQWLPSLDNGVPGNPRHQTTREVNEISVET